MKILLIDADSKIPNIALMKLSTFHKAKNDSVELLKLDIPYYPHRKHIKHSIPFDYDKIYCSIVFDDTKKWIKKNGFIYKGYWIDDKRAIYGGSGFSLGIKLPNYIENLDPDYSLYPDCDTSYGFISRGCIRKCYFCKVPKKEGYIHQVNSVDNIVRHKKTKFLDNNILALPNHKEILQELIDKKIKCQFNQGLDIRLINKENSFLLSKMDYLGEYFFAFDSWRQLKQIEKGLALLNWRKKDQIKFFLYVNANMELSNIIKRILYLKKNNCLPYVMRDKNCWKSEYSYFFIDIAAYCNQPNIFKKMSFLEYAKRRHPKNKKRAKKLINLFYKSAL